MSEDFLSQLSRQKHESVPGLGTPILYPEIPDPPAGFDPEANPVFTSEAPQAVKAKAKTNSKSPTLIPKAKVFIIGPEGDPEYDQLLTKGGEAQVVLGKKEVTDMRGSPCFKVYLEWMEVVKKKRAAQPSGIP